MNTGKGILGVVLAMTLAVGSSAAGPKDPVVGAAFNRLVDAQDVEFQQHLLTEFPESAGYVVAGPLDPLYEGDSKIAELYRVPRVICATLGVYDQLTALMGKEFPRAGCREAIPSASGTGLEHVGRIIEVPWRRGSREVLTTTFQQTRWLIWLRDIEWLRPTEEQRISLEAYAVSVSASLRKCDEEGCGWPLDAAPKASDFGLPADFDFYPPRPDYVIQGYQNYKKYLHEYADMETFFADGILAFIPSDSLLEVLKRDALRVAWPNKEAPVLQYEFREFFDRGGDVREIMTLTNKTLGRLKSGEYFYAVGANGRIRFGYEMPRDEINQLEENTGASIPRANHAFLFPGEPVLTAGTFVVIADPNPRIVKVNTQSGHYFYSNVSETIRRDIAVRSDEYLLTIGHFFVALERSGVEYRDVLISKM